MIQVKQPGLYHVALMILPMGVWVPLTAQQRDTAAPVEIEAPAMEALNRMGAYLRTLKSFQVEANITNELVLDDGQKVQFATETNLLAHLPDRLLVEVEGEDRSRLYLFDGKTFTVYLRRAGYFSTVPASTTIAELADILDDKYEMEIPLVDLFLWGGPRASSAQVTSATDIGPGQVGGVSCQHYVFRQPGLDWQVWIQKGDYPLPRKLVLTTTTDEAKPQHTSVLTWNLAPSFNDSSFVFTPPPGVHRIPIADSSRSGKN